MVDNENVLGIYDETGLSISEVILSLFENYIKSSLQNTKN